MVGLSNHAATRPTFLPVVSTWELAAGHVFVFSLAIFNCLHKRFFPITGEVVVMGRIAGFKNKFNLIIRNTCLTKCNDFRFALAFRFHFFSSICSKQARTCCMNAIMDHVIHSQTDTRSPSAVCLTITKACKWLEILTHSHIASIQTSIIRSHLLTLPPLPLQSFRYHIYIRQYRMQLYNSEVARRCT